MNGRALVAGVAGAAAAVTAVLVVDPFDDRGIGCPFYEVTGQWCPGCGSTRAAWLLLHGDIASAARHNLLFLPALAYVVATWLHTVSPAATARLPGFVRRPTEVPATAMWGLVVALVAFTIARNLPVAGFLAPPALTILG